ncbi:MAG: cytochrome c oxidase accessory protein CcoG [Verrucomicrobiota bacterium]
MPASPAHPHELPDMTAAPPSDGKPPAEGSTVTREVNWEDFREHLATADRSGNRRWLYPKRPSGRWHDRRRWLAWGLLVVLFAGPFIRIQGNPLLMFNLVERKFSILGQIFWPEDAVIFAVAMLVFLAGIMVFTTAFGRLWCGWACPQTVMMEMVFRKLEYLIEGDAHQMRALDAAPWTARKILKKGLKHGLFLGLSFVVGNTLLSYLMGSDALYAVITDDPRRHLAGLGFMILFTLLFYGIFARFREQACTFICPYGRFQSALLDENTLVVAYDRRRGEGRGPWRRDQRLELRRDEGLGDCVDCRQCVAVCPTGIDIRDGVQMECVNCTACMDACDAVMDRLGRPRGLVRHASLQGIEEGRPLRFTARMKLYSGILAALVGLFLFLVLTRADVETLFLRAPGGLYQPAPGGRLSNLYTVKVVNKAHREMPVEFRLEGLEGRVVVMGGGSMVVPPNQLSQTSVLIELDPAVLAATSTRVRVGVYSGGRRIETVQTAFIGPRR